MSHGKIDHQLFSAHENALTHEPCPQCGQGKLQLRHGKHGPFLGCDQYPACDFIKPLHQRDGHIIKELGVNCPDCGHELVLRQGRYGMFIGCSDYPQCHFMGSIDGDDKAQTPSSECHCPECATGVLVERKSRYGKTFWACDQYPRCKFAVNSKPVEGECEQCRYPLLMEKKSAHGIQHVCANRRCGHSQSTTDSSQE